jgi:predicted nucleic acid-binding protein
MPRDLIDTDVLIDYLRDRSEAVAFMESLEEPPLVSALTVAELYAGVREGRNRRLLDDFVARMEVVPLDRDIAIRGGRIRRDHKNSSGVGPIDAMIAATAEALQARLITRNPRHFPTLSNVLVPYR